MSTNNPKPEKPDLSEWRKQNPGKTINDYYRIYGNNVSGTSYSLNYSRDNSAIDDVPYKNDLSHRKSNYSIWSYLLVTLFILITFFSNPKKDDHKDALRIKLSGIVEEILAEKSDNIFQFGFGRLIGDKIIDETLKSVSIDNYVFFSLTKFNYASDSKILGFGFLGKVYISDKINREMVINSIKGFNNQF
ncbi:MAG: hypothetical protein FD166_1254 [Bacteroidetes bacterium]|nr:MAG: hypothetical protein FD166_1254 [Bacteroidota bacterium]